MTTRVGLVSLGCSKNLVDSEAMLGLLHQAGMEVAAEAGEADLLIVNTCGFLQSAIQESVDAILDLAGYKKHGHCRGLIVSGCLTQRAGRDLLEELPEVDAVVGTADLHGIVEVAHRVLDGERGLYYVGDARFHYFDAFPRLLATPAYSAYVKLSEGCSHNCTFCVIPQLRGPHVSRPEEAIAAEVERLAEKGVAEFNLLAQDSTSYGIDLYGERRLPELLRRLNGVPGVHWLRVLYAYPSELGRELIETIAELPRVANYIDMPLQHGSDAVLRRMRRPERRDLIRKKVSELRSVMPGGSLRSTFIVGFPGETDADFEQLVELVCELELDHVGVFEYSREPGTPAAAMPDQVPGELKKERRDRLMTVQQQISRRRLRRFAGSKLEVLVEGRAEYEADEPASSRNGKLTGNPLLYYGRHQGQAPDVDGVVLFEVAGAQKPLPAPGDFVNVQITGAAEYDLVGRYDL